MEEWDLVAIGSWPITDDVISVSAHLLYSLRALYMRRPKAKAGAAKHRRMKYLACSWLIDLSSRPIGELHFVRSIVPVVAINSGSQASQLRKVGGEIFTYGAGGRRRARKHSHDVGVMLQE